MRVPRMIRLPGDGGDIFDFQPPVVVRPFSRRKSVLYALICLLWMIFGIFGRDPWKPEETLLAAVIADMAINGLQLSPMLLDAPYTQTPPLYLWLAALPARWLAGVLPAHEGARVVNIALLGGGLLFIWLAQRRFYGVRAAWLAVLLVVGCVGMMVRAHMLNVGVSAFFGMAATLWGASFLQESRRRAAEVLYGGGIIAAAAAFLLLANGLLPMLAAAVAVLLWVFARNRRRSGVIAIFIAVFVVPIFLWRGLSPPLAAIEFIGVAKKWHLLSPLRLFAETADFIRVAAWSLFPLLPLAVYCVWVERRKMTPFLTFAITAVAAAAVVFMLEGESEEDFYLLLPPLAVLAARALQVMPNDNARILDFFALMIAGSIVGGGLWLIWAVLYSGAPQALAMTLQTTYPGFFLPPVSWFRVAAAAALSLGWIFLIANFGHSNERAAVNWSGGVTVLWAVFNLLLVGYVDSGKSYLRPAAVIQQRLGDGCLQTPTDVHWRAQLHYAGVAMEQGGFCDFYLSSSNSAADGARVAQVNRGGDAYYLYRRF